MCAVMIPMLMMGALSAVMQHSQAEAAQKAANQTAKNEAARLDYQNRVVENERTRNEYDKQLAIRSAMRKTAGNAGNLRLLAAVSGVDGADGSALDMLLDNASHGAEDIFAIQQQAKRTDSDLRAQQNLLRSQADYARARSQNSRSFLAQSMPFMGLGMNTGKTLLTA